MRKKNITSLDKTDIKDISTDFEKAGLQAYSGQAAFFLMLSFFPFMMFFFALLDLTPLTQQQFFSWVMTIVPESFWGLLSGFAKDIYEGSSRGRLSFSIITAVYLSSKAFVALSQGLNSMYHVKETRGIVKRYLYSMLYSIVFALTLLLLLGIMVFGNYIYSHVLGEFPVFKNLLHFRILICIPVLFGFFLILYAVLPDKRQRLKYQIPGAVVAAAGWMGFSYFFSIYVNKYTRYSSFYGTMTTIALIMVWLYGCMYVLFVGGFINREIEKRELLFKPENFTPRK